MTVISARTRQPGVDTVAVMIIDRMASVIGALKSCSFTLTTSTYIEDPVYGLIRQNEAGEVYPEGPGKMHVNFTGDKGHRGLWHNGQMIFTYSFDENNYAVIESPDNLTDMMK